MLPGGDTKFYDQYEFDTAYRTIIPVIDVILAFYIILIDYDVFHSNEERKHKWRNSFESFFSGTELNEKSFPTTSSLLKNETWTSLKEFSI